MKRLRLIYAFAPVMLFGLCEAQAGIYVEPFLGYVVNGELNQVGNSSEWDTGGLNYGARAGWQTFGFSFGAEYSGGKIDAEITTPGATGDLKNTLSITHLGVFASYQVPMMLRFFGTYYVSAKAKADEDGAGLETNDEIEGKGLAIGAGYTFLKLLSFNLQYKTITYDDYFDSSAGAALPLAGDIEVKEIILSVSFPFSFL